MKYWIYAVSFLILIQSDPLRTLNLGEVNDSNLW